MEVINKPQPFQTISELCYADWLMIMANKLKLTYLPNMYQSI